MTLQPRHSLVLGLIVAALFSSGVGLELAFGWFAPTFRWFAHLFYEKSALAELRLPSALVLARWHVSVLCVLAIGGLILGRWMGREGRAFAAIFCVGYAIRAGFWIFGGNLPLVPGDSCHYIEVATSVYRGQGPVKHYVESFFVDYTRHGFNTRGAVLDDWATPLWAYVLGFAYRLCGVVPGAALEATFAVAKGTSFFFNVMTLPLLFAFVRRHASRVVSLVAMALLAVMPAHALYAGMELRESLVSFLVVLAAWGWVAMLRPKGAGGGVWASLSGVAMGLAILARSTSLVIAGIMFLGALAIRRTRVTGRLIAWTVCVAVVIAPWAWATTQEYGEPFFSYTKYYPYNFAWSVHHFDRGNTAPGQFYTARNAASIVRVKLKSVGIVFLYSAMILGAPVALAYLAGLRHREDATQWPPAYGRWTAALFLAFLAATLVQISDVTQVQQLARYYLPVYLLMLPVAADTLVRWLKNVSTAGRSIAALIVLGSIWSNPAWAYDATWYTSRFQERWPALVAAGDWIRAHPEQVPGNARLLTWFPWELRVTSDRSTVLFPRALEGGQYELNRLRDTIAQYRVTHILWGSFEPGVDGDPEWLGSYLQSLRESMGLSKSRSVWKSARLPYPVELYRLDRGSP